MSVPGQVLTDVWQHLRNRDQYLDRKVDAAASRPNFSITNQAASTAEVYLYDEIGYWGVTASDFLNALATVDADAIDLHVNSPGGDVFDGVAIYNALVDHPATVNVIIDGLAASAASFIAMAGDRVTMNRAAQMMIHDASGICWGNAGDMQQMKDILDRVSNTIAGIYSARAGESEDFWRGLMQAETWYSGSEAVAAGLADAMVPGKSKVNGEEDDPDEEGDGEDAPVDRSPSYDLAAFKHAGRAQAPAPPVNKTPAAGPSPAAGTEPEAPDPAAELAQKIALQLGGARA